jgi:MFS-type transporter involved in bile tolerance (Atg22 family)
VVKYLVEKFSLHRILVGAITIGGISFIVSSTSLEFWNLAITMLVGAACCCIINITSNISVLKLYGGDRPDFWVQLLHTLFGVGGLIGPFMAAIFGAKTYFVLGICLILIAPIYCLLQSPENRESARKSEIGRPISNGA